MTATVELQCTITNAKSNQWGYTGSPLTVTLTNNTTKITQSVTNKIFAYNRPVSPGSAATKRGELRGMNYKVIRDKIIIEAWLDNTTSGDTAITKKNKLVAMTQSGELCTLIWRSETFDGTRITGTPSTGSPEQPNVLITSLKFVDNLHHDPASPNPGTGVAIMKVTINCEKVFRRN